MQLTSNGIVLRHFKTDEDRILTILTEQIGVVTAYANGANRLRSKLASSTELLCFSTFVLFGKRDRYVVDKADSNHIFFGIRSSLDKLSLASYFSQLTMELAPCEAPAGEYLSLLLNTLHFVEKDKRDPRQLKAIYELRLLTLAGYMPNLVGCCLCGRFEGDGILFSVSAGQLYCDCTQGRGLPPDAKALSPGVLAAMRHIVYAQPDKLFAFALSSQAALNELEQVSERYLVHQVEKMLPALHFYHQMAKPLSGTQPPPKTERN